MNKVEAIKKFKSIVNLNNDKPSLRESWNNFVDIICKDGLITEKQYNKWDMPEFCKDEVIPEHKIIVEVKRIEEDSFSRPRLQNLRNNRIYADINCGDGKPSWYTTTHWGEPEYPVKENVQFVIKGDK